MKQFFNKNKWAKPVAILVALILAWKLYGFAKGLGSEIKNSAMAAAIATATKDISPVRAKAVITVADNIYSAFHKDSLFGFFEDEVKAMSNFNTLQSVQEAIACAYIYRAQFGRSLSSEIMQYCHYSDFDDTKQSYLNAITNV